MVNITSLPLYTGKITLNLLNTRLDGPQSRSGRFREEKNLVAPGIEHQLVRLVA
jgi:hypothetical protein